MDIFVINLDADPARMAFMDRRLGAAGLPYERVPAVDGRKLRSADAAYYSHPLRRDLSPAEIGCLISHLNVWRRLANGAPRALVLEDDVHFSGGVKHLLDRLVAAPDECVVHRLETLWARVTASRTELQRIGDRRAIELFTNHAGAAAYVLTRQAARRLVEASEQFSTPPDGEMFDFERRAIRGLRVVQWTPAPFIQDRLLPNRNQHGFGSRLEADRHDIRTGHSRVRVVGVDDIKAILRPAYTALYDVALRSRGRTRLRIPFG